MLFTSASELRFYFPTHAIDTLDPFMGVIDNSEHDFLQEKLGTSLYNALCQWYNHNGPIGTASAAAIECAQFSDGRELSYYNRLLLLSQRCVAYDAMSRAVELGIVSPNNGGINVPTSDDYGKVDLAAIEKFRQRCVTEAHAAVNRLLQALEDWCRQAAAVPVSDDSPSGSASTTATVSDDSPSELGEIVTLWRQSRFFYIAAGMLIPSARVLQEYLNIYDSREKFIQLLPDLRFLQEEILAPAIGEDLCAYLVEFATTGKIPNAEEETEASTAEVNSPLGPAACNKQELSTLNSLLKKARKYLAAALENRTLVLKTDKLRRQQAHDEAVRLLASLRQHITNHQNAFPETIMKTSPLYTPPPAESVTVTDASPSGCPACCNTAEAQKEFHNNRRGAVLYATPFLD